METYLGGVFSRSVHGGRAGATLRVTPDKLLAETADGVQFELDLHHCKLDLGGASGGMWFCRPEDSSFTLYSEQPGFGHALQQVPMLRGQIQALLGQRRHRTKRTALLVLATLFVMTALLVVGYFATRAAGRAAVVALPTSVDARIGEMAIGTLPLEGPTVDAPDITQGIDRIVQRLAAHAEGDFEYHVRVVRAPIANAFALPGGQIVVYTGLIEIAQNAEEIAAILAHEMSHVTARHGLSRIAQSVGVAALAQLFLGDVSGLAAVGVDLVQSGALTSYGRNQEREADRIGLHLLHRAGIGPSHLAGIFGRLKQEGTELPGAVTWLSTHPNLDERIRTVEGIAQTLGKPKGPGLEVNFAAMRAALHATLGEERRKDENEEDAGDQQEGKKSP